MLVGSNITKSKIVLPPLRVQLDPPTDYDVDTVILTSSADRLERRPEELDAFLDMLEEEETRTGKTFAWFTKLPGAAPNEWVRVTRESVKKLKDELERQIAVCREQQVYTSRFMSVLQLGLADESAAVDFVAKRIMPAIAAQARLQLPETAQGITTLRACLIARVSPATTGKFIPAEQDSTASIRSQTLLLNRLAEAAVGKNKIDTLKMIGLSASNGDSLRRIEQDMDSNAPSLYCAVAPDRAIRKPEQLEGLWAAAKKGQHTVVAFFEPLRVFGHFEEPLDVLRGLLGAKVVDALLVSDPACQDELSSYVDYLQDCHQLCRAYPNKSLLLPFVIAAPWMTDADDDAATGAAGVAATRARANAFLLDELKRSSSFASAIPTRAPPSDLVRAGLPRELLAHLPDPKKFVPKDDLARSRGISDEFVEDVGTLVQQRHPEVTVKLALHQNGLKGDVLCPHRVDQRKPDLPRDCECKDCRAYLEALCPHDEDDPCLDLACACKCQDKCCHGQVTGGCCGKGRNYALLRRLSFCPEITC